MLYSKKERLFSSDIVKKMTKGKYRYSYTIFYTSIRAYWYGSIKRDFIVENQIAQHSV